MKTSVSLAVTVLATLHAFCQQQADLQSASQSEDPNLLRYSVVERGADFKAMRSVCVVTNAAGAVSGTNRYTVLGSGLNRRDDSGNWVECKPVVQNFPGGIVCTGASYSVVLNTNLNRQGSVDMELAGQRIISHPLALAYFDPVSGRREWLAQIKDCQATVTSNQVMFADAFGGRGIEASVVFDYGLVFHQNVVFTKKPGVTPADLGMSSRTRLEVVTEILRMPAPTKKARVLKKERDIILRSQMVEPDLVDETLIFSERVRMPQGYAFANDSAGTNRWGRVPVGKRLRTMVDGRTVLVESVEWRDVSVELGKLPTLTASLSPSFEDELLAQMPSRPPGELKNQSFAARLAAVSHSGKLELARAEIAEPQGVVLDYVILTGGTSMALTAGTYLVSGDTYFDGLTCGPGVVVKFDWHYRLYVGAISPSEDYASAPAVFTSKDDNSAGESLGNGSPSPDGGLTIDDLHDSIFNYGATLTYLETAVEWTGNDWPGELNQCEFRDCNTAVYLWEHAWPLTVSECSFETFGSHYGEGAISQNGAGDVTVSDSQFNNCPRIYWGYSPDGMSVNTFSLNVAPFTPQTGDWLYADVSGDSGGVEAALDLGWNGAVHPSYYYSISGYSPEHWKASASSLGLVGQTITTFNLSYYAGEVSWAGAQGIDPDADGDGLPDAWERQYFGNLNQTATGDYDGDGASNLAEYNAGSNPAVWDNLRLAHWRFDPPVFQRGDNGQMPLAMVGAVNVPGVSTNAVALTNASTTQFKYRIGEATGNTNILPRQGTVAFWYQPSWSSTGVGGVGPGVAGRLMEMGIQNTSLGWWGLLVDAAGDNLYFATHNNNPATLKTHLSVPIHWTANTWHQIVFAWSASATSLYVDGEAVVTGGLGVDAVYSNPTFYNLGFRLGSDYYGNNRAKGTFDELMVFNYAMDTTAAGAMMDADGDQLPDAWEWSNFGRFAQTGDTLDGMGNTLLYDYQNGIDPTVITFSIEAANNYVRAGAAPVQLDVRGVPYYQAVLVDDTNFASATWTAYTSSNLTINLGSSEGWHEVWIGLKAYHSDASAAWAWKRFKLDSTPPWLVVTNPASDTVMQPMIQLMGYSPESLGSFSCRVSNAAGVFSNQMALVLDQCYDTNTWEFTTNNFQVFDVDLTNGVNTFTLWATDLAGNQVETNFSFTLVSNSVAPVINLSWPTDGAKLVGDTFLVNGTVDNPTAKITLTQEDANGVTNLFEALVERDGRFWVENLTLGEGTTWLTLTAVDVWGNTSMTNFSVSKNPVTATMDPVPEDQLWQNTVSVSGTVSDPSYAVWVNGVPATVNPDGTWSASDVPVIQEGGTATFEYTVYPPDEAPTGGGRGGSGASSANPPSANAAPGKRDADLSDRSYVETDESSLLSERFEHEVYPGAWVAWDDEFTQGHNWRDGAANSRGWMTVSEAIESSWFEGSLNQTVGAITWPVAKWPYLAAGTWIISPREISGGWFENPLWIGNEHCEVKVPDAWMSAYDWGYSSYTRHAQTKWKLFTGGKAIPKRNHLFVLRGAAWKIEDKRAVPLGAGSSDLWTGVPKTEIPKQNITMGELGPLGSDGLLWRVLPNGATREITPKVAGVDFYTFLPRHTKYGLTNVCHAPVPANRQRTTVGVGEEVDISFPALPADIPVAWRTTAGGLSATNGTGITFTAPSNGVPTATVTATVKGQACPIDFSVLEPSGVETTVRGEADLFNPPYPQVGAGMHMDVVLQPTTVSFYRVQMKEPPANATATGWFENNPLTPNHDVAHWADQWYSVSYANLAINPPANDFDHASSLGWPIGQSGSYTWPIEPIWRVGAAASTHPLPGWTPQIHVLSSDGTVRIDKLGHHVIRHPNESTGTAE